MEQEKRIALENELLRYSGRIDKSNGESCCFVFPYSSVSFRIKAAKLSILVENLHAYWENSIGFIIDGKQSMVKLSNEKSEQRLVLMEEETAGVHDVMIFKRQDGCHYFCLKGIFLEEAGCLLPAEPLSKRRIEVYGDSVSAGEVSEAVEYAGKEDPVHEGEYSNSWYSYAAITARKLNAQLHDIAQGGIALLPGTGYFVEEKYVGMEEVYDKIQYNPLLGTVKKWDFSQYVPHVVIVAIGQNDKNPVDFMKEAFDGEQALRWREHYKAFIRKLRGYYKNAYILLTTTILYHDANWDRAIEMVCESLGDAKIKHFLYQKNGVGTPGHVRIPEAEEMAEELAAYIESLEGVWEE